MNEERTEQEEQHEDSKAKVRMRSTVAQMQENADVMALESLTEALEEIGLKKPASRSAVEEAIESQRSNPPNASRPCAFPTIRRGARTRLI